MGGLLETRRGLMKRAKRTDQQEKGGDDKARWIGVRWGGSIKLPLRGFKPASQPATASASR
jgi:hypothetical protein